MTLGPEVGEGECDQRNTKGSLPRTFISAVSSTINPSFGLSH